MLKWNTPCAIHGSLYRGGFRLVSVLPPALYVIYFKEERVWQHVKLAYKVKNAETSITYYIMYNK